MRNPMNFLLADTGPDLMEQVRFFFEEGGLFMGMLAVTSVVGLAAVVFKWLSMSRQRTIPKSLEAEIDGLDETAEHGRETRMLQEFKKGQSALARLGAVVADMRGRPRTEITEAVQSVARAEIVRLQAGMTVIDVVISVAPLLGLLGTASGLVVVFAGLESDADWLVITGGIGRALKTTIVGMAIAVPAIIAQGYFQRRIDTCAARLEVLLTRLARVFERPPETASRAAVPPPLANAPRS